MQADPPMDLRLVREMYRFMTWANDGLRAAITAADEEKVRAPLDLWYGSVFRILAHVYSAEFIWLSRVRDGVSPPRLPAADDFASVADLAAAWRDMDEQWERYIGGLDGAALTEAVPWTDTRGRPFSLPRWQLLLHLANHSTQHRAHAADGLTLLGIAHGPQDMLDLYRPPAG